ncbi:hypothetical protein AB6A40_011215 [Gnathostoma spinigerum]|uniref:E3 ubiquitin-protein ligase ARIH1-like UBA-like domain-containing protein n=1 Tax=Gnathostoma spinigerum TaxID=75299 RepID=A0ABD6F2K6_9BILA
MDDDGAFSGSESDNNSNYSEDDGIIDPVINTDPREDHEAVDYKILDSKEVLNEMNIIMEDVSSVVRLPKTICRLLLHHYKWNKDTLLER